MQTSQQQQQAVTEGLIATQMFVVDEKDSVLDLDSFEHKKFQSYKFEPLVVRLQAKLKISEQEARSLFSDLMTWMYICTKVDKPINPPEIIDEAWHNFILFTKEYNKFCQSFCGRFIHHLPYDGLPITENRIKNSLLSRQLFKQLGLSGNWIFKPKDCGGDGGGGDGDGCAPSGYCVPGGSEN